MDESSERREKLGGGAAAGVGFARLHRREGAGDGARRRRRRPRYRLRCGATSSRLRTFVCREKVFSRDENGGAGLGDSCGQKQRMSHAPRERLEIDLPRDGVEARLVLFLQRCKLCSPLPSHATRISTRLSQAVTTEIPGVRSGAKSDFECAWQMILRVNTIPGPWYTFSALLDCRFVAYCQLLQF